MSRRIVVFWARVVIEAEGGNTTNAKSFFKSEIHKFNERRLQNANLHVDWFDDDYVREGDFSVEHLGVPITPEMEKHMDFEFEDDDPDPEHKEARTA